MIKSEETFRIVETATRKLTLVSPIKQQFSGTQGNIVAIVAKTASNADSAELFMFPATIVMSKISSGNCARISLLYSNARHEYQSLCT